MSEKVLKIPCQLEGFKFKKTSQEWEATFTLQKEDIEYAKPLMDQLGQSFVMVLVHIKDKGQAIELLKEGDLLDVGDIDLNL